MSGPGGEGAAAGTANLPSGYVVLMATVLAVVAGALIVLLPTTIGQDTWLALVGGREVARHGIPHHETLTLFSLGRSWRDQQWLAELCMYGLFQIGGVALVGIVNVALITLSLGAAAAASFRLGADPRTVLRFLPVPAVMVAIVAEVRTQPYAYPLFVATLYLLCRDSRRPSPRVLWCLPMLVLWANLHGSASLGAALVSLRGATLLWKHRSHARSWGTGLGLLVGGPLCLMITPYGPSILAYYKATLLNSGFHQLVVEWQPVTSFPALAVVFFIVAAALLWLLGRHPDRTTVWERCALLVLIAGGIIAMRNVVWFAFASLILLPVCAGRRDRVTESQPHPLLDRSLAAVIVVALVAIAARALALSTPTLEPSYPAGALAAVHSEIGGTPGVRVFADVKFADWLLWRLPALDGRMAYDARFELLTASQLRELYDFNTLSGLRWSRAARGYALLVLDRSSTPDLVTAERSQPGTQLRYAGHGVSVLVR